MSLNTRTALLLMLVMVAKQLRRRLRVVVVEERDWGVSGRTRAANIKSQGKIRGD